MREAELREQQVRAWEARTRKEVELVQKGADAPRARSQSQSQSAPVPLITRVFSKEVWQPKPRTAAGAMPARSAGSASRGSSSSGTSIRARSPL